MYYGLSDDEREGQFSKNRDEKNPDHARLAEGRLDGTHTVATALAVIRRLLEVLADMLGVTYEELSVSVVRDEKMPGKYIVMVEALEELKEAA